MLSYLFACRVDVCVFVAEVSEPNVVYTPLKWNPSEKDNANEVYANVRVNVTISIMPTHHS